MRRRLLDAFVLATLLWPRHAAAEQARDAEFKPTAGTASISGVVVTGGDRPQPIRRAIVTLSGPELRPSRGAVTNDEGRFTFTNLPAGRFTLTAARPAFITSMYGAKRPGRPGTAITVADGQRTNDLIVRLWRGASIAGVVRDESGEPVADVPVTAIPERRRETTPTLTLSNNATTTTNDQGEFRIFGLEPGVYAVAARPSSTGLGQIGALAEAEVDAALEALKRRSAPGAALAAAPRAQPAASGIVSFDYAATYYPGTAIAASAGRIILAAGQDVGGIDFAIQRLQTATISGAVTGLDGQPLGGVGVILYATGTPSAFTVEPSMLPGATTRPDGTFTFSQVAPGDYRVFVRASAAPQAPSSTTVSINNAAPLLWGLADLSVSGSDVTGVAITLQPAMSFAGRVVFEGKTATPPAGFKGVSLNLRPLSAGNRGVAILNGVAQGNIVTPAQIQPDGSFEIRNVAPDTYRLFASIGGQAVNTPGPNDWWLKSAMVGGRDVLDTLLTIAPGENAPGAVLTFSDQKTEIDGALQTASGQPASDVFVIAYAADRAFWGANSRRVQAVRPGVDGRYSIKGLPPGTYLLSVLVDVDQDEWQDPAFLEQLVSSSIKVTLDDGGRATHNLRIGG
jgi:uncharacterized protein (DUF2141 family)